MADLINNLLQRSGIIATYQESPRILKPRLPSLYEPSHNLNQISTPSSEKGMNHFEDTAPISVPGRMRILDHENLQESSTILPAPPQPAIFHQQTEYLPADEPAPINLRQGIARQSFPGQKPAEQEDRQADFLVSMPSSAESTDYIQFQQEDDPPLDNKPRIKVKPLVSMTASTASQQEQSKTVQGRLQHQKNQKQDMLHSMQPNSGELEIVNDSKKMRTIRPYVEAIHPSREQAQIDNTGIFTQGPNLTELHTDENKIQDSVVHIHIGRIDVRATSQSGKPPTARAAPVKPKMSLDDYLQGREGKQ